MVLSQWTRPSIRQQWTSMWPISTSSPSLISCHAFDREGVFSENGQLKKVPVSLTNFDVFWTGARIQF